MEDNIFIIYRGNTEIKRVVLDFDEARALNAKFHEPGNPYELVGNFDY